MKFYVMKTSLSIALVICFILSSCVETETVTIDDLFPDFEEEPLYGSLDKYRIDRIDLGFAGESLVTGVYKGKKNLRIIRSMGKMVALDPGDNSVLWKREAALPGDVKGAIFDYQNHLLVGTGNDLEQIDANTGERLKSFKLWEEGLDGKKIVALDAREDFIYTLTIDFPNDSIYSFEVFEHRPEQNDRERIFSLEQERDYWFIGAYSEGSAIPQEIGYDAETDQLIFPLFIHDHPDYDYGLYTLSINRKTREVDREKIPARFLEAIRPRYPIVYKDNLLSFYTSHLHVYSVKDKELYWEVIGGKQQPIGNHVLQVIDENARLYNIYSGEVVWSSEYPTRAVRSPSGINDEETYFFFPRGDRLSVYDLATGELAVHVLSDIIEKQLVFFDKNGRLNYVNNQGILLVHELNFD